jgi:hypothetical protein
MRAVHRHTLGHEHEFEPQHGLPEALPSDEHLLWQGAPDWRTLAVEVFHVRKLAVYFALMLALRAGFVLAEGGGVSAVLAGWVWMAPLALVGLAIVLGLARLCAHTTAYSITDKRVVMRIGIVLTVTFNIPFKRIDAAGLLLQGKQGHGDIPLTVAGNDRIPILQLWPHARAWHIAKPQPTLRCLPDAARVGHQLSQAWSAARGLAPNAQATALPQAASNDNADLRPTPALARGSAA